MNSTFKRIYKTDELNSMTSFCCDVDTVTTVRRIFKPSAILLVRRFLLICDEGLCTSIKLSKSKQCSFSFIHILYHDFIGFCYANSHSKLLRNSLTISEIFLILKKIVSRPFMVANYKQQYL